MHNSWNSQNAVVALIVLLAGVYVLWSVMPARWRAALAAGLLASGLPLRSGWRLALARHARGVAGCGCSGCDAAPKAKTPGTCAEPTQSVVQVLRGPRGH